MVGTDPIDAGGRSSLSRQWVSLQFRCGGGQTLRSTSMENFEIESKEEQFDGGSKRSQWNFGDENEDEIDRCTFFRTCASAALRRKVYNYNSIYAT